jgi:hypothetical protein
LRPLFPYTPKPVVVNYVVKNRFPKIRKAVCLFLRIGTPAASPIPESGFLFA